MKQQTLFARLLPALPQGKILHIAVGANWTAVLAEINGSVRCGLSATLDREAQRSTVSASSFASRLSERSSRALTELIHSNHPLEVSIGMAAVNALLPPRPDLWIDLHSKDVLARLGRDKTVVMVGHFPFAAELRSQVGRLFVLEQNPHDEEDLPAEAAPHIIPQADILALTAMTLLNHTFDELIALRPPAAPMIIIGPSTPLSPLLFEAGATVLSGAVVEQPQAVLRGIEEGANFRQLRKIGVRLVSMIADPAVRSRLYESAA
jgi:uncharacterized protein (DUF4213/DUF364 family)